MKLVLALRGSSLSSFDWSLLRCMGCMVPALTRPPAHQSGVAKISWLLPSPRVRPHNIPHPFSDIFFFFFNPRVYLHTLATAVSPFRSMSLIGCHLLQLPVALHSFSYVLGILLPNPLEIRQRYRGVYSFFVLSSRSASDRCFYAVAGLVARDSSRQRWANIVKPVVLNWSHSVLPRQYYPPALSNGSGIRLRGPMLVRPILTRSGLQDYSLLR